MAGLGGAAEGTLKEGLMLESNMFIGCCCSVFLSLYLFVWCVTLGVSCSYSCNICISVFLKTYYNRGGATKTVGHYITGWLYDNILAEQYGAV